MKFPLMALAVVAVVGCAGSPQLREALGDIPELAAGQARVYFYGDTTAWKGLRGHRHWRPSITLGSETLPTRHGEEVVFFVDRPPGVYTIGVDNDVGAGDPAPPQSYPGQSIELDVRAGRTYYLRMIRHGETSYLDLSLEPRQHYLELRPVREVLGRVEVRRFHYGTE